MNTEQQPVIEFGDISKEEGDALFAAAGLGQPQDKPKRTKKNKKQAAEEYNAEYVADLALRKCALNIVTDTTTGETAVDLITDGKDEGLSFNSFSDARKTAEIALFAVTNPEVRDYVLKAFVEAYKKSKE